MHDDGIGKGSASDIEEKISKKRAIGIEPGLYIPRVLVAEDTETSRMLLFASGPLLDLLKKIERPKNGRGRD